MSSMAEAYLHPIAFTGARDCEGARKSVKFDLPARPLALNSAASHAIKSPLSFRRTNSARPS